MSGHSKFANIKHKKEKNDAAKGKIFTQIGRELAIAVKEGGSADPVNNSTHHKKQFQPYYFSSFLASFHIASISSNVTYFTAPSL